MLYACSGGHWAACARSAGPTRQPPWHCACHQNGRRLRIGEHHSGGVRGVRKKRADGPDDTRPGGAPFASPVCNIGRGLGCFCGAKKEPIPLSHTAGHHASSPMLQMGFKRGHTMWESWSALFFALPGMGVYCIRFQLSVLTGSSAADRCDSRKCIMSFSWPAMAMR